MPLPCDGSDLRSLIAAAHSADSGPVNPDSKTDPRSATIVVGSSVGERSRPAVTGLDTAPIRSSTAFAGRVVAPPRRGVPWLMVGLGTLLVAGGVGAGVFFATRGSGPSAGGGGERTDVALQSAGSTSDDRSTLDVGGTAGLTSQPPSGGNPTTPANAALTQAAAAERTAEMPVTPASASSPSPVPDLIPDIVAIPEQLINELEPFSLLVELTNIAELRGKVAFALAPGAPRGMRIDASTGLIRWEPGEADGGPDSRFPITVQVKPLESGIVPAETAFIIRVAEVNLPPRITLINQRAPIEGAVRVEAVEGEPVEVLIEAADDDLPPNPLRMTSVRALPPGAELLPVEDNPRAWRLKWTPGEEHGGADPVIVALTARDGLDSSEVVQIVFDVAEVNVPPVLASLNGDPGRPDAPWEVDVNEGETLELHFTASDVDLPPNPLELAAIGKLPGDAKIVPVEGDARSWKLVWTPGEEHGGEPPFTLRLMVRDGVDNSDERRVIVNVAEVNQPPVLATIGGRAVGDRREWPLDAREGELLEVVIVARDDDLPANPLRIEAIGELPPGAKFEPDPENPRAWKLLWTPGEEHGGDEPVRIPIRVRDDSDHSETTTLVVKVAEVNIAPTFAAINGVAAVAGKPWEVSGKEGAELQVTIVGDDLDLPPNALTLAGGDGLPEGVRIEPVKGKSRTWTLTWTPGEEHGGDEPVPIPLKLSDDAGGSVETTLLARIAEVNHAPVLPEIAAQSVGLGETFTLEIPLSDPDLPRQALEIELEQPVDANATAELVGSKEGEMSVRLAWTPSIDTDLGQTRTFTLRVRDNGEPPLSTERSFEVSVGRYVTNSIGMQLALLPPGTFMMGNLNPELLEKMVPKAPEQPKQPERPGVPGVPGANPPRPNAPGQPNNPNVPVQGTRPAAAEAAAAVDEEKEEKEPALTQDDLPIREVTLTRPLYIGAFEVTQQQYAAVMEANPSYFQPEGNGARSVSGLDTATLPVESVTYEEAVEFCRRLSALPEEKRKGRTYRLPSETEWEYACRGGRETLFHTGDRLSSREANFDGRFPVLGAAPGPHLQRPAAVGSYEPNAFGLHDMHGNVSEWCRDWYAADAYAASDPLTGPEQGEARVIRGGSYRSKWAYQCRSSIRDSAPPTDRSPRIGFRVVCEVRKLPSKARCCRGRTDPQRSIRCDTIRRCAAAPRFGSLTRPPHDQARSLSAGSQRQQQPEPVGGRAGEEDAVEQVEQAAEAGHQRGGVLLSHVPFDERLAQVPHQADQSQQRAVQQAPPPAGERPCGIEQRRCEPQPQRRSQRRADQRADESCPRLSRTEPRRHLPLPEQPPECVGPRVPHLGGDDHRTEREVAEFRSGHPAQLHRRRQQSPQVADRQHMRAERLHPCAGLHVAPGFIQEQSQHAERPRETRRAERADSVTAGHPPMRQPRGDRECGDPDAHGVQPHFRKPRPQQQHHLPRRSQSQQHARTNSTGAAAPRRWSTQNNPANNGINSADITSRQPSIPRPSLTGQFQHIPADLHCTQSSEVNHPQEKVAELARVRETARTSRPEVWRLRLRRIGEPSITRIHLLLKPLAEISGD